MYKDITKYDILHNEPHNLTPLLLMKLLYQAMKVSHQNKCVPVSSLFSASTISRFDFGTIPTM